MTYTVVWKHAARDVLADIWINTGDRAAITKAANRIDRQLKSNPRAVGESRSGERRVLVERPLVVFYEVHDSDRKVIVARVRHIRGPNLP